MSSQNGDRSLQENDSEIVQEALAQLEATSGGYGALLTELKQRIRTARVKAALSVNRELVILYWQIGRGSDAPRIGIHRIRRPAQSHRRSHQVRLACCSSVAGTS